MRDIANTTIHWTPTTNATAAIAESEYHGLALARMLYTNTNAHDATAIGNPRFIKAGLRSIETLPQC